MRSTWRLLSRAQGCGHNETVIVSTGGITRVVCERCGHVEIRGDEALSGVLDRRAFARGYQPSKVR